MSNLKTQSQISNLKSNVRYRAYHFSLTIINFIKDFPNQRVFWVISDQLLRSATSIGANLIEAKSASSKRDFIKYYEIALKSANETRYWLCLLRDSKLIFSDKLTAILDEAKQIADMIASSLLTMKKRKI